MSRERKEDDYSSLTTETNKGWMKKGANLCELRHLSSSSILRRCVCGGRHDVDGPTVIQVARLD